MSKVWRATRPFLIKEIQAKSFIFSFESHKDMQQIMLHKPWLFDTHLLSLKSFDNVTPAQKIEFLKENFWVQFRILPLGCMNSKMGKHVVNTIVTFKEYEVHEEGLGGDCTSIFDRV